MSRRCSDICQTQHQHRLRNRISHSDLLSSSQSASNGDKLNDVTLDVAEPPGDQPLVKRKRGWPKGLPRKKGVIVFLYDMIFGL